MAEKIKAFTNKCYVLSIKEIVAVIMLVLALVGAYNSVLAQVEQKYSTKENSQYLEKRLDSIDKKLSGLLDYFSIKGIEK